MSPKNAIKMINIQKYYLVHISPIWSMLVHSTHFGSIRFTLVLFSPYCRVWSNFSTWSYLVDIGPIPSYLFLLRSHCSTLSYSVHLGLIRSSLFPFDPILSIRSTLFHLVHLCSLQSIFVHLHTGKRHV